MNSVNLVEESDSITELYEYKQIVKMNDTVFTLVKGLDRKLEFHFVNQQRIVSVCAGIL